MPKNLTCKSCTVEYTSDLESEAGLLRLMRNQCLFCAARTTIVASAEQVIAENPDTERGFVAKQILRGLPNFHRYNNEAWWPTSENTRRFIFGKAAEILGIDSLVKKFPPISATTSPQAIWLGNLERSVKSYRKWPNGRFVVFCNKWTASSGGEHFKQQMFWSRIPSVKGIGVIKNDRDEGSYSDTRIMPNVFKTNFLYSAVGRYTTGSFELAIKTAHRKGLDQDLIDAFVKELKEFRGNK